jgi:lipopolysaccharide export system protein LptC
MNKTTKVVLALAAVGAVYYFYMQSRKKSDLASAPKTGTTTSFTGYSQAQEAKFAPKGFTGYSTAQESKFAKSFTGTAKSFK